VTAVINSAIVIFMNKMRHEERLKSTNIVEDIQVYQQNLRTNLK
jgi:hypothetical protein